MKGTILEKILDARRIRVDEAKRLTDVSELMGRSDAIRSDALPHRLQQALTASSGINIIAEFKRASPSKGSINESVEPAAAAQAYENGGAAAISVLTEEDFFKGSLEHLRAVRKVVGLPLLRKDFIFDQFQIYEAAEAGADAILLIAAMLADKDMLDLYNLADKELGIDVLVEVHTLAELERVNSNIGAKLIGVNNRNLHNFDVSLDVSRKLIEHAAKDVILVSESGLRDREDLIELSNLGYSGFLIGETLMRNNDPEAELKKLGAK